MILKAVERMYRRKAEKGYSKVFIYIDLHETVMLPNYKNNDIVYYSYAKETLQLLSKLDNVVLGIYSSSYHKSIAQYQKEFKKEGINFIYFNANPEVQDTEYGCFSKGKFYFDLLIEDKAGFDAETEWKILYDYFKNLPEVMHIEETEKIMELLAKDFAHTATSDGKNEEIDEPLF